MKILTIITSVRNLIISNRESVFRQCVETVHAQKCVDDIEHLIVDGCSTDATMSLIEEYVNKGWVRVISMPDKSVYDGMNHGIDAAVGRYILFLNSDDFLCGTKKLSKVLDGLEKSGFDFGYGDVVMLQQNGHKRILAGDIDRLPYAAHFCHQSMIVKTDVIRRFGGFDIDYRICADNELTMRLIKEGCSYRRNKYIFACYRDGGLSATAGNGAQREHGMAFYNHYGRDIGLTESECIGLWYYSGIHNWSEDKCRTVLKKLEWCPKWAAIWCKEINAVFRNGQRTNGSAWRRFSRRWEEFGIKGLYESIKRRI